MQRIVDTEQRRTARVQPGEDQMGFWDRLLDDLRAFDAATATNDEVIPLAQALAEIEAKRT